MNAPAPRALYTTAPTATFYGNGRMGVCCPSSWSDAQVRDFAAADPSAPGAAWQVTSAIRVPCDCRPGYVHIQLGETEPIDTRHSTPADRREAP